MAQITWVDKVDNTVSGLPENKKVTAATTAEIKSVVNANETTLNTAVVDIAALEGIAGSVPFTYNYSTSTAASDPGAGTFRFDNIDPSLATHIYINENDAGSVISSVLDILVADSVVYVQDRVSLLKSGTFKVVSVVDNTTWYDITVTSHGKSTSFSALDFYGLAFVTKAAAGAGSGTVTSVSGGKGINISGTPTVAPVVDIDLIGADNYIEVSTDLEGTAIDLTDTISYNDATDGNIKKGLVSDLPFDQVAAGTGITAASVSNIGTVSIDYLGTDNFIDSATDLEGTDISQGDTIAYHDATDSNVKKGKISDLPFQLKTQTESFVVAIGDETTDMTTGTAKVTFRMPYAFTLTAVRASVTTAPTGSVATFDINESGVSILSTKITIDATEKTSTTAATAPVISDSSLADDAEMTVDIDGVGSTIAGAGGKIYLIGYQT